MGLIGLFIIFAIGIFVLVTVFGVDDVLNSFDRFLGDVVNFVNRLFESVAKNVSEIRIFQ